MSKFKELYKIDVNNKIDNVQGKTYLSWAWAWAEFKKIHPDAKYKIKKNKDTNLPFFCHDTGIIVYTKVYADGLSYEMWLPVMNSAFKAMKIEPYTYKTKSGNREVNAATMTDINKTIMRCLTKNLAMFGLGLYIYAREDYPDYNFDPDLISSEQVKILEELIENTKSDLKIFLSLFNINKLSEMYADNFNVAESKLKSKQKKIESENAK